MLICILPILIVVALCLHVLAWRRVKSRPAAGRWLGTGLALFGIGTVAGLYCAFLLEYQVSPTLRFVGFPIPVAIFHLESGRWIDYVHHGPVALLICAMNVISVAVALPLPVALLAIRRFPRMREGHCVQCGYSLIGNTSGVCPECGTPLSRDAE